MNFFQRIFSISNQNEFRGLSIEIANFQLQNCEVYRNYAGFLGIKKILDFDEIPFLPISFFKSQEVISKDKTAQSVLFKSSGTGNEGRSKHCVVDVEVYKTSFIKCFQQFFGNIEDSVILAILPNYLEQGDSSLIFMVQELIHRTKSSLSGFVMGKNEEVYDRYQNAKASGKKVILFGVSYSLISLAEDGLQFPEAIIIETGGMKGRRKEITKMELHEHLKKGLGVQNIHSEYGMTELLSQAYTFDDTLVFKCPNWMEISIRDVSDPFSKLSINQRGAINIIDLANYNSCSFIAADDTGRLVPGGFVLEGRLNNTDLRGCNQLVE